MALKLVQGKQLNTNLTGSFTGSFKGDGSLLTGVTGEWDGTLNGNAQITGSLSQGTNNLTLGNFSHAEGSGSQAFGTASHAEGHLTLASGSYSHAEGYITVARGNYSHAEGIQASARGIYSHAEGQGTFALGTGSHAEGNGTSATGNWSHAEGESSIAFAKSSHAEGLTTQALGDYSHTEGSTTQAIGEYSHAEGDNTRARGNNSHAEGENTVTIGQASHAEGYLTVTSGSYSHAEGSSTQAIGDYSHAEGSSTKTGGTNGYLAISVVSGLVTLSGDYGDVSADYPAGDYLYLNDLDYDGSLPIGSFVIDSATFNGTETEIQLIDVSVSISTAVVGNLNIGALSWAGDQIYKGPYSHAEGDQTIAPSQFSHAEGRNTVASGDWSHAEGYITRAIGQYSHAEGTDTQAIGEAAHAEGDNTQAVGGVSHAEGTQTQAIGYGSHAEGDTTQTIGEYSHAEGLGTITSGSYQHVQGQYNITSSAQSAFIIGNGTSDGSRSNLVFASGSQFQITGSLTVSGSNTFTNIGPAVFSGSINVTQGISGSFSGSGANLNSIPASAITGLSSTQIATGSVTASVSTGTGSFQITSGSTSLMFISSSGRVGIGTSTPANKVDILGDVRISNQTQAGNNGGQISIRATDGLSAVIGMEGAGWNALGLWAYNRFTNSSSPDLKITTNYVNVRTNLFINTATDAGFKLDVAGSARITSGLTVTGSLLQSGSSTFNGVNRFISPLGSTLGTNLTTSAAGLFYQTGLSGVIAIGGYSNAGGEIQTGQNGGISVVGSLLLQRQGGNVAIGTATDTGRLTLRGSGATSATTALLIQNSTPTNLLSILDNGQVAFTSPTMSLAASQSAFSISPIISASAVVGGQYYGVNITPTFFQTTGSQTETAFRVAATYTGSSAAATGGTNIIADFGSTSAGSQLTVTDVTSGSIYMVNDVSGLPIIEATSDWGVKIYDFPRVVFEKTGSQVNINGTLQVSGSFILPLSQSATPQTGSAYWSGSLLFIYNGTRYMSASFF